jgi:hypothetical protein
MKQTSLLFFALVVLLASCKTDVELNAPYKNTTIIFGLLDRDSNGDNIPNHLDTQWIKINKTFLGEGDNNVYAGIRDSSEYKEEDFVRKVVEQIDPNGDIFEYDLIAKTVSNRSINGIFYGPEQTLYFFVPPTSGLVESSDYRIMLEFSDGRVVSATTNLVRSGGGGSVSGSSMILASISTNNSFNYTSEVPVSIANGGDNASVFEASIRFHYTEEIYASDDWSVEPISRTPKFIDYYIGSATSDNIQSLGSKLTFSGRSFFQFLQNNLIADQRIRRVIGTYDTEEQRTECFDILVTIGNSDLRSYIDVNSPSTGVVQERPIYSNVSNGIGLFASRGTKKLLSIPIVSLNNNQQPNLGTLAALVQSEYTSALNFCDPNGASDFSCDN